MLRNVELDAISLYIGSQIICYMIGFNYLMFALNILLLLVKSSIFSQVISMHVWMLTLHSMEKSAICSVLNLLVFSMQLPLSQRVCLNKMKNLKKLNLRKSSLCPQLKSWEILKTGVTSYPWFWRLEEPVILNPKVSKKKRLQPLKKNKKLMTHKLIDLEPLMNTQSSLTKTRKQRRLKLGSQR